MPELHPIRAIRFAGDTPGLDLTTRIAPPYDVLDEDPKQALLGRDAHNIVAIDLPVTPPKTVGPDAAYREAGDTFGRWLDEGVLTEVDHPAVFAYEQIYTVDGRACRRRELIANVTAEPFGRPDGGIHQHEHTIRGGVDDRTKLMNATGVQLSPVFGMFHDPDQRVTGALKPWFDREPDFFGLTAHDHVEHRCWVVDDAKTLSGLGEFFSRTDVFIADGHHRYNTALKYAQAHPDRAEAQRCLMVLVAIEDPGMIVLPTHRAITGLTSFSIDEMTERAAECGLGVKAVDLDLEAVAEQLPQAGHHAMGLFDPKTGKRFVLTSESSDPLAAVEPNRAGVWRKLDVAVLHNLLIDRVLRPNFGGGEIGFDYTADLDELQTMCKATGALGVIMQPTPVESVCAVSRAGEVMPPKSTFFFPKLATGLVINPLG
jgi:uncharacterized protein (DUF1015 family)